MKDGMIQFFNVSPDEHQKKLMTDIRAELDSLKKEFQPKQPTEFLTRQQVAELLDIDLSTLHNWTKKGKLQAYGLAGRVYYKRSEIEKSLKPL